MTSTIATPWHRRLQDALNAKGVDESDHVIWLCRVTGLGPWRANALLVGSLGPSYLLPRQMTAIRRELPTLESDS
jgi:hypothetical protein